MTALHTKENNPTPQGTEDFHVVIFSNIMYVSPWKHHINGIEWE